MRSFPLADYEQRVPMRIGSLSQCFTAQRSVHGESQAVLLKQLLPAFARVPAIAAAWLARAEENSRLDHPGCCRVLEWGEALGEAYLTLPALPVVSLRELIQAAAKSGLWPSAQAVVAIARAALDVLAHVYADFGLLHLDVDPHAILLRKDGSVLLSEFGMWRALPAETATRERFDRGRVAYLSPELTKSLEGDARSDVFSLGAVLYELIGKQRPFQGATQLVTAMAIAEGRRRPLRELAPEAPELLCDIVETMLAQKPEERFQSAQAALGAFSSCCEADPQALAAWLESIELRAGPQTGFARGRHAAAPAPRLADAASDGVRMGASPTGPAPAGGALNPPVLAPAGALNPPSPLPPPLIAPPALASAEAAHAQMPPQDDWLAPPPLLSPGRAPASLEAAAQDASSPSVRDGRTAFLDTGQARAALAHAHTEPREPELLAPGHARIGDMVTRDTPAHSAPALSEPRAVASFSPPSAPAKPLLGSLAPPSVPAKPLLGSLPPPSMPARPLLGSLPPPPGSGKAPLDALPPPPSMPGHAPLDALPPPSVPPKPLLGALPPPSVQSGSSLSALPSLEHGAGHHADKRGWQEPSKTVFQVKSFAKQATRRSDRRAPLLVIVLISVAFGFALVAGGALLWRLFAS